MLKRTNKIKDLRDVVMGIETTKEVVKEEVRIKPEPIEEKPIRNPRKIKKVKHYRRRTKERQINPAYEAWMVDVKEAVDYFIGMDMEVLPSDIPWEKWFADGLSPTKAAKQAVEMHEDLEDEEEFEEDVEEPIQPKTMNEVLGYGQLPYATWTNKIDKMLKRKVGSSLIKLKQKYKISNPVMHSWYMAGYTPGKVFGWLAAGKEAVLHVAESVEVDDDYSEVVRNDLMQTLRGWTEALRINKKKVRNTRFLESIESSPKIPVEAHGKPLKRSVRRKSARTYSPVPLPHRNEPIIEQQPQRPSKFKTKTKGIVSDEEATVVENQIRRVAANAAAMQDPAKTMPKMLGSDLLGVAMGDLAEQMHKVDNAQAHTQQPGVPLPQVQFQQELPVTDDLVEDPNNIADNEDQDSADNEGQEE